MIRFQTQSTVKWSLTLLFFIEKPRKICQGQHSILCIIVSKDQTVKKVYKTKDHKTYILCIKATHCEVRIMNVNLRLKIQRSFDFRTRLIHVR